MKSHFPSFSAAGGISQFRGTQMTCSMAVTLSQKRHHISVTSNLMFMLQYFNNHSVTQRIKIPFSLDVILEWQTLSLPPPPTHFPLEFLTKQKPT